MNLRIGSILFFVLLMAVASVAATPDDGAHQADLARGRYLVENVGLCADCHTPRGQDGAFRTDRWLMGSEVAFTPTHPIPGWATVAPAIAGLPSYSDEEAITLLTTGIAPGDRNLAPPMPPYRFTRDDAVDVVAYLRSLAE
ncbi:MAG TPA: c-type cytochrome [Candidatus Krumholzibacteria bacterium]|nr:c-type cytochrome [Candidatus Krumholzibacteria bacterium]HPD73056.1 c-type cytochrome [Candidatus Krumholzibacteria bacterium]HRY41856.1 c-type cytochrome [Candidatus Krumholzibacteria bacterium]